MIDEVRWIRANLSAGAALSGPASSDRIEWIRTSLVFLPLAAPISDAKVQRPR